jgi:capsular exopolysaccharide synthesis family protein
MSPVPNAGIEAYRVLRTNLLFSRRGGGFPRSVVVTSAAPGEGKTVTATNLAIILAREGMRVLLVDCDLRRARLHRLLGVPRQPGLAQLLRSSSMPPGAICATAVPGLFVLPGGAPDASSGELLASSVMRKLLGTLTSQFDIVVIDSPPVLSLADASILGALADAVLLVVRAGQTDRGAAQEAAVQLAGVGSVILGTVLNDPHGEAPEYLSYYATYAVAR